MKPNQIAGFAVATLLVALSAFGSPAPTTGPSTRPTAAPATRPAAAPATRAAIPPATQPVLTAEQKKQLKVMALTRKSLELFKDKKYAEAEAVIKEALVLEPDHAMNIYNLACLMALTNRPTSAMDQLEHAADAGFADFIHIEQDTDLVSLRTMPRYKALIAAKDQYQKKDADKALAAFKKQLGDKYLYEIDTHAKLIFAANTDPQTLAAVKTWLGAQARSQWEQLFEHHPDQYVAIVLPTAADYHKMVRMPGVEGIYMHGAHMLIARRLGQVMTHEFTHALHAADLDPLGQQHPIWIVEGLASLFEAGQFEGDKLVPHDNFRLGFLQSALRQKQLIPLSKLVTLPQSQFIANAMLGYGQASSIMLYLYEHHMLRAFYDGYKANFEKDPTGKLTLEKVAGKPLDEFERDWQKWMAARTPPGMNTGPDGVFIGVQFAQENDGLKIQQVINQGPADHAGIKPGDVVVGLNNVDIRDQQSLMPLLKNFKPGDGVTFKLRRGEKYIQIPLTFGRHATPIIAKPTTKPTTQRATTQPATPLKREHLETGKRE